MKRIPRIKFPQRHPKPSGSAPQQAKAVVGEAPPTFFSRAASDSTLGGKASDQPKRTPMSKDEIEAILVCKSSLQSYNVMSLALNPEI